MEVTAVVWVLGEAADDQRRHSQEPAWSNWELALSAIKILVDEHGGRVSEVDVTSLDRATFLLKIPVPKTSDR
jgi:hypothetical protein